MSKHINAYEQDRVLTEILQQISEQNPDFWSFHGRAKRDNAHAFFQYPAMMVPQMQSVLLEALLQTSSMENVYDPFVGSGTVMVESMLKGLNFLGQDINPLAVLLCKAKSGPMDINSLETGYSSIRNFINNDTSTLVDIDFDNINKWFRSDVQQELSKIRRSILRLPDIWCRRFFWIVLAETVRLTSNSRTSNFKLYSYTEEDILSRDLAAIATFFQIARRNLNQFAKQRECLTQNNLLDGNNYKGVVEIKLGDTRSFTGNNSSQVLITSPPYGDNSTTVTYGQFSYLPLQWIPLEDIDDNADISFLATTQEIDRRSLGGSQANANSRAATLLQTSESFAQIVEELRNEPPDRVKRVSSFFSDLELTINPILSHLQTDSYMIWIVGNRNVGGLQIPMNRILRETLEQRGCHFVCEIQRTFPDHSKRMGNLTNTMPVEQILVMRKVT